MNLKKILDSKYLTVTLGAVTLFLFATRPYLLELLAPGRSIGQIVGENAKDIIDGLNGKSGNAKLTPREIWWSVLTMLAFLFLVVTIISAVKSFGNSENKWLSITGVILSVVGLAIYISHLAIGLIGFLTICLLIGAVLFLEGL